MLNPDPRHTVHFTVDDFEKMIDAGVFVGKTGKIELLEGELFKMSPASWMHDALIELLLNWSAENLIGSGYRLGSQVGFRLFRTESLPEPDLLWVDRKRRPGRPAADVVPLVIEVSLSSLQHDREYKGRLYAMDGVREYWVVDGEGQAIEVYCEPAGEQYASARTYRRGEVLSPRCLPGATLDLERLFSEAEAMAEEEPDA